MPSNILDTKVKLNKTPQVIFFSMSAFGLPHILHLSKVQAGLFGVCFCVGVACQQLAWSCRNADLSPLLAIELKTFHFRASGCSRIWYQCWLVKCRMPAGMSVRFAQDTVRETFIISIHTSLQEQTSEKKWGEDIWRKINCSYRLKSHIHSCKELKKGVDEKHE